MISYDDFAKIDIRIGEIKEVEIVEGADKLLKLRVDVGDGIDASGALMERQIISGIRTYFEDPQVLVGKKFPFLVNLEQRTIRGFESQGMILAGSYEDTLALLTPTNDVPVGTRLK